MKKYIIYKEESTPLLSGMVHVAYEPVGTIEEKVGLPNESCFLVMVGDLGYFAKEVKEEKKGVTNGPTK